MEDCIFCKIISGQIPSYKIYEDNDVFAFLDINPINPDHTLVVPKAHYENLIIASVDIVSKVFSCIKKIAPAVISAVGADSFNIGINNGASAGQLVRHLHIHFMPRFSNDGHVMWKGKRLEDLEMASIRDSIVKNI